VSRLLSLIVRPQRGLAPVGLKVAKRLLSTLFSWRSAMAWQTLTVNLPKREGGWEDAQIGDISVWGNGNGGRDLWGWPNAGAMHTGNIVANDDGSGMFHVYLDQPSDSSQFVVVFRVTRNQHPEVFGKFMLLV
jgi:hypothetical protein